MTDHVQKYTQHTIQINYTLYTEKNQPSQYEVNGVLYLHPTKFYICHMLCIYSLYMYIYYHYIHITCSYMSQSEFLNIEHVLLTLSLLALQI